MNAKWIFLTALLFLSCFLSPIMNAQRQRQKAKDNEKIYLIETHDGVTLTGKIISSNSENIVIETKETGEVSIPKYKVKRQRLLKMEELSRSGKYLNRPLFYTRYLFTANAFALGKGEKYLGLALGGRRFRSELQTIWDLDS